MARGGKGGYGGLREVRGVKGGSRGVQGGFKGGFKIFKILGDQSDRWKRWQHVSVFKNWVGSFYHYLECPCLAEVHKSCLNYNQDHVSTFPHFLPHYISSLPLKRIDQKLLHQKCGCWIRKCRTLISLDQGAPEQG